MSFVDFQIAAGGQRDPDSGRCAHFGDPVHEMQRLANGAAVADLSGRVLLEVTGSDRAAFLHNFTTADVKALQPGSGSEAFLANVKGRIVAFASVYCRSSALWLETRLESAERVVNHLERYIISEDVTIRDRSAEFGTLLLTPGQKSDWLGRPLGGNEGLLEAGDSEYQAHPILWHAARYGAVQAYHVHVPIGGLGTVWDALVAEGATPSGWLAAEALRIRSGIPVTGVDVSDENLVQEAGRTRWAVSFGKGCYLGQEPIARLDAMGHTNRDLRVIEVTSGAPIECGSEVRAEGQAAAVGQVTSASAVPDDPAPVGLAMLRSQFSPPGQSVQVRRTDGSATTATVLSEV